MATLKIPVTLRALDDCDQLFRLIVTQHDHIRGLARAPVTLVEYGDYECPHCGLAHPIVNALREQFGFKLRFVFRHFPLSQVHPNAEPAAEKAPNLPAHTAASGRCWAYRNPTCAVRSRTGNLRARCEAISSVGYAAASTVRRHSSSMACATMDPTLRSSSLPASICSSTATPRCKGRCKKLQKIDGYQGDVTASTQ
jgi:hypothetical protein